MKDPRKNLIVPFTGLKDGKHQFTFEIDKSFFDQFEYSLIDSGNVIVEMELDKNINMLTTLFDISGSVDSTCDRCTDPLTLKIKGNYRLVFKFGDEESENEDLIVLPEEAYELHLADFIYEFITLCTPSKKIHKPGECNEEMMKMVEKHSVFLLDDEEEDEDDDEDWLEEE